MTMTLTNTGLIDLSDTSVREANATLQAATEGAFTLTNPGGKHALACGLQHPVSVTIEGHTGYYAGGMNKHADITIHGNAGTGLAENIMSGVVRVTGDASQSAGATGHGGLVVIEGNASARCGISMKGVDIVVGGNVGHMSAFMAQAGNLVVLGDAGPDLGDSIYEAQIFVRGSVSRLGTDCIEKEMRPEHIALVSQLMDRAGLYADPAEFRRYGSARQLYHFKIDNAGAY